MYKVGVRRWRKTRATRVTHLLDALINGPAHFTVSHHLSNFVSLVVVLVCLFIETSLVWLVLVSVFKMLQNIRPAISWLLRSFRIGHKHIAYTFLELTFPADVAKSAYATEQLHILLRGSAEYRSWLERLAARPQPYSLELVATNDKGIRYVISVPTSAVSLVRHMLLSYLPGLKIAETTDYLSLKFLSGSARYQILELTLTNDFVVPLANHKLLNEHDHTAYLTGQMTDLLPGECIAVQTVVVPVLPSTHRRILRRIRLIERRIGHNQELNCRARRANPGGRAR